MTCPRCDHLGREAGSRCENCGYDFALLPADRSDAPFAGELPLHDIEPEALVATPSGSARVAADRPLPMTESALPLFSPADDADDEPLIKLPATPRPPLAVRRTPDTPRLRAVPRLSGRAMSAPALQFSEEPGLSAAVAVLPGGGRGPIVAADLGLPSARAAGAALDHAILLGIDLGILYFTVRIAGLSMGDWRVLPVVPMLVFLALLKMAYFAAFTAFGGQTIGKMAVGTRVVAADGQALDIGRALRRTAAGALSFLLLGLGFVPALFGDGRALHDRLAGTRVVRGRFV